MSDAANMTPTTKGACAPTPEQPKRHSFTDLVTGVNVTLVIPPDGMIYPLVPQEPKIGVEHPGCPELADILVEYDSFYCAPCRWNGRVPGAWVIEQIEAAPDV